MVLARGRKNRDTRVHPPGRGCQTFRQVADASSMSNTTIPDSPHSMHQTILSLCGAKAEARTTPRALAVQIFWCDQTQELLQPLTVLGPAIKTQKPPSVGSLGPGRIGPPRNHLEYALSRHATRL